ncbi:inositol-pentakisphosphate 2-kinase isoform X2 [Cryptomeria japonica]|uniref:inositol-pentakisphosphate 2-kinase isoform X2 n=1 Tax=Cryptomeria japonica TaxID=3369 RepID=UPI0027DAA7CF|nr:inositol-pentakisphosphate 2-kinase isoform X2 [Cryptomeria japonica]
MVFLLEAKDAEEWGYRGEGAANVVMGYRGTSPEFVGKVLRVKKASPDKPNHSSSEKSAPLLSVEEQVLWSELQELVSSNSKEILAQGYAQHVIGPLLGSDHVDPGTLVCVSKEFLEALDQNIYKKRPEWRIRDTRINLQSGYALLMSDHATFSQGLDGAAPCISVEIKVASISKYCPIDLFSESRDRIHQAIGGLLEIPQNNLWIFLNGSLIFGGLGGYAEEGLLNGSITEQAVQNLEDILENVMTCQKGEQMTCFKDLITESILETRMLSKLLAVQKMDLYDIEGAIHEYFNIIRKPCQICTCSSDESDNQMHNHIHDYFTSLSLEESRRIVCDFLVATTAKDCSLMLTFQPVNHDGTNVNSSDVNNMMHFTATKQTFRFKAYYVDLDLKRLEKLIHYYKLDQKIVSIYTRMQGTNGSSNHEDSKMCEPV